MEQENTQEQGAGVAELLQNHQAAKDAYLESKERLKGLHSQLEKHKKVAAAAHGESEALGREWRELLRVEGGELTKEIQKLRGDARQSQELAEEHDQIINEVGIEYELERLKTYGLRLTYLGNLWPARRAYARYMREKTFLALAALPEWADFYGELSSSKLIKPSKGEREGKLEREFRRLIGVDSLPVQLEDPEGYREALEFIQEDRFEVLSKELSESLVARARMRESLISRQAAA